jgi:hypothetical protein
MRTRICYLIILFILVPVGLCRAAEAAASLFPLEKGSYWVYKGTVKWTPEGVGSRVRSRSITWRMKIRDVIESPKHRIAIVTGFPGDLSWYEEGMTPRWSLLVEDDRRIYRGDYETKDEALGAARAIKAGGRKSVGDLECILEFPLKQGKKYGTRNKGRADATYAWSVEGADEVSLRIKGYDNRGPVIRYRLASSTNPDRTVMEFVSGLGVTRYIYEHHGTVAFEDVRLVEYGRSRQP